MTIISKAAGGLSLVSCIRDIHKTAMSYSTGYAADMQSDSFIQTAIGASKQNGMSARDAQRKNWVLKNNFLATPYEIAGSVKGYAKGFFEGSRKYLPNFILSTMAIFVKNKRLANISAAALAGIEIIDFFRNSTRFGHRTDYLK